MLYPSRDWQSRLFVIFVIDSLSGNDYGSIIGPKIVWAKTQESEITQ
jgi:hypothetical protein